jgi:hypothetical protein
VRTLSWLGSACERTILLKVSLTGAKGNGPFNGPRPFRIIRPPPPSPGAAGPVLGTPTYSIKQCKILLDPVDVIVIPVDATANYDTGTVQNYRREWLWLNETAPPAPPVRPPSTNTLRNYIQGSMVFTGGPTLTARAARLWPGECCTLSLFRQLIPLPFPLFLGEPSN